MATYTGQSNQKQPKPARPFLSFLRSTPPVRPVDLADSLAKDLPLLPPKSGPSGSFAGPAPLLPSKICLASTHNASPILKDTKSTPDNLFPPLRYGSPTTGPSSHPGRSQSRTPTPQGSPGTPSSILSGGRNTPSYRNPLIRFASPLAGPADTPRTHLRSVSNTPRTCTAPTVTPRNRSATVQSTNTFGHTSPEVLSRDYATTSSLSTTPQSIPHPQSAHPSSSPKGKRRHKRKPSALTLRTTNLDLSDVFSPETPTPTSDQRGKSGTHQQAVGEHLTPTRGTEHPVSALTRTPERRRERRRSQSTGDLSSLVFRQGQHRVSQSESDALGTIDLSVDTSGSDAPPPASSQSSGSMLLTPMSTSLSMMSDMTVSPAKSTKTSQGSSSRFENVPLPWSTQPLHILESDLLTSYLSTGVDSLIREIPHILAPDTLVTLSSEQARLQLELERLRVKHTRLSQHRDQLIDKALDFRNTIEDRSKGVQEMVARVDRVARQVYLCNDQLRQMEIMKRDHECGVLLWALLQRSIPFSLPRDPETGQTADTRRANNETPITPSISVPDINVTRATIFETPSTRDTAPEVIEILSSPMLEPSAGSPTPPTSRNSVTSLTLSPTSLAFPIPPARGPLPIDLDETDQQEGKSSQEHEVGDADMDGEVEVETEMDHDYDSSFGHGPDMQGIGSSLFTTNRPGQILIYPPTHLPSRGLISPGMPQTPYRSEHGHGHGFAHDIHEPMPRIGHGSLKAPISLRTRRSKPDLTIPIPGRPVPRPLRADKISPVKLGNAVAKKMSKTKTKSIRSVHADIVDGQKGFKRGRESRLDDTESILCHWRLRSYG